MCVCGGGGVLGGCVCVGGGGGTFKHSAAAWPGRLSLCHGWYVITSPGSPSCPSSTENRLLSRSFCGCSLTNCGRDKTPWGTRCSGCGGVYVGGGGGGGY